MKCDVQTKKKKKKKFFFSTFFSSYFLIVIDVPDIRFLLDLQNNKKLKTILDVTKSTAIDLIIHFTPDKVFKTASYQHFIDSIGAKRQLIVNERNK